MNFANSTLFVSARSPFARRVRVALLEHGVPYEEKVVDVFKPQPELVAHNPLARVPTLCFADGGVLVESEKILSEFYATQPQSAFAVIALKDDRDRHLAQYWSAMALGLCDKSIEFYLECMRPEASRDAELFAELTGVFACVLDRFERFLGDGRESILPEHLTQADFDMGVALAYVSLRFSSEWQSGCPLAAAFLQRLNQRPSFQATRPPAA